MVPPTTAVHEVCDGHVAQFDPRLCSRPPDQVGLDGGDANAQAEVLRNGEADCPALDNVGQRVVPARHAFGVGGPEAEWPMVGRHVLRVMTGSPFGKPELLEQPPLPHLLEHQRPLGWVHRFGPPPRQLRPCVVLVGDVEHRAAVDESVFVGAVDRDVVEEDVGVAAPVAVALEDPHQRDGEVVVADAQDLGLDVEAELGGSL